MTSEADFDENCDFCAIARDQSSGVEVLCEGPTWVAFFPLEPATPGHTLVIPRRHVQDLWHLPPELHEDLMRAVVLLGQAVNNALAPEGMNLISSAGSAAEQTIFHLHLHVVPRWKDDGFGQIWPTGATFQDVRIDRVADRIREACLRQPRSHDDH